MTKQNAHLTRGPRGRQLLAFFIALMFAHGVNAGSKTSADFLKIPIGAQGAGLGQAYTAQVDGIDAMNWNPAGLANSPSFLARPSFGLSLTHQEHLVDTSLDHLGIALAPSATRSTALGLNIVRLSFGSQEGRDDNRQKTGGFSASDLAVGLVAARRMGNSLLGAQLKLIEQEYAGTSARGFALDLGFQTPGPIDRMNVGLSVRNLGPQMKFVQESYRLPLTISAGTSYRVTGPLSLLVDVHARPHQDQVNVSAGAEFAAARSVMLRAGYLARIAEAIPNSQKSETQRETLGGVYGLAAGLGLRFGQFAMDYAITPFGELGNAQTLTLASWFGGSGIATSGTHDMDATSSPAPEESQRKILILPLDNENWWGDLR